MSPLFTIGIFLSLFLAILLFAKPHCTPSDKVLGVWLMCIGFYLLNYYLHYLGYWAVYPHLVGATHPFPMLFAPFLYLYVTVSLREQQRFYWKDSLHFLPFVLTYVAMFPFLFGYSATEKAMIDSENYQGPFHYFFAFSFIEFVVVSGVYFVLSYRKIGYYQRVIGDNFAYNEGISLQWLRLLLLGFVLILGVMCGVFVVLYICEISWGFNVEIIPFALFVLLIFLIGFWGIRYQGIFSAKRQQNTALVVVEEPKTPEYRKSGLKTEDISSLHQALLTLMNTEKPHLEAKLTLAQLAERLGVTPNNLSQIINQCEEKNFYDFINGYRVQEFITLAQTDSNKNLNLLGIALEAGFNSKSSFNQVFKKIMGETPSQYLKNK